MSIIGEIASKRSTRRGSIDDSTIGVQLSPKSSQALNGNGNHKNDNKMLITPVMLTPASQEYQVRNKVRSRDQLKKLPPVSVFAKPPASPLSNNEPSTPNGLGTSSSFSELDPSAMSFGSEPFSPKTKEKSG